MVGASQVTDYNGSGSCTGLVVGWLCGWVLSVSLDNRMWAVRRVDTLLISHLTPLYVKSLSTVTTARGTFFIT